MRDASGTIHSLLLQLYGIDTMSNASAVHVLRNPIRSLQETCASLLAVKRVQPTVGVRAGANRATATHASDDEVPTQWPQTTWSETSVEPRLP